MSVSARDGLDELLLGIGLPDDLVEVALKGETQVSDEALARMKRRTLAKVQGAERVDSPVRRWHRIRLPLAASIAAAALLGALVRSGLAPDPQPPAGMGGSTVQLPGNSLPSAGQGGDAIDIGPLTGDIAHDASATIRTFFEIINEGDYDNPRRLILSEVGVDPEDLKVEGVQRYTFIEMESFTVKEEFWKSPGDLITARVVIDVEAQEGLSHPVFKPGRNSLTVRMYRGGDGRWVISQFETDDGEVWPAPGYIG